MNAPIKSVDFRLDWPAEGERRAPYRVFGDPAVFELEQARIYRGPVWSFLGLRSEVPHAGDFKATFIGDTPVVLTRNDRGELQAWVNRCAHRGALVCRELRGNVPDGTFTCVYHQWAYDAGGALVGVPFRKGLGGKGGYPADFDMANHGLRKLRVETVAETVFATFSDQAPGVEAFLGEEMCGNIRRVLGRPIEVLGHSRQYFSGNWKLYAENARDSYHGALLHLFYPTFGIYRQGQEGWVHVDPSGMHMLLQVKKPRADQSLEAYQQASSRKADEHAKLAEPSILNWHDDFSDGIPLTIQSLFPSLVVQQISNTLAVRQILPKTYNRTELVWTYYGFRDDDADLKAHRLRQFNMVGPAGFISMEDGEAVEICQQGVARGPSGSSFIEMGGRGTGSVEFMGVDENPIRGFWKGYRQLMGF